ncbi:MAG: PepSY-associated TM helix domain-containing protein [Pseudomonadota bacterium]
MGLLSFISNRDQGQTDAKPRKKKSSRKRLYELHTWVGFHLAVIMVVVLFTGTIATISNELDWLTQHDMRVSPDGEMVSHDEMIEAVQAYAPGATITGVQQMMGDHFAYRVIAFDENATQTFIHVNQWTGEVTGETPYFTIQRFFRDMHRYLYLPKIVGLTLVCSMGVILSISLYTGLKTSRNWRTLMTRIRFSKGARTAIGDAHKAAGLWSIWFFVLMITTGLWYYAEFLGKDFEPGVPDSVINMTEQTQDVIYDPSANEIIGIAQEAYPDLNIKSFNYSVLPGSSIRVIGSAGNPIVRDRANAVYIDPVSLEVLHVRRSEDLPAVQWTNQIADPLHFGDFAGLPLKLVYFVFGAFMTGLSVSGVWLTWRRLKSSGATRVQLTTLPILVVSALFASLTYTLSHLPIFAGLSPWPYVWFVVGLFLAGGALLCAWWLKNRIQSGRLISFKNAALAILTIALSAGAANATLIKNPYVSKQELSLGTVQGGPVEAALFLTRNGDQSFTGEARFIVKASTQDSGEDRIGRLNAKSMTIDLFKDGEVIDLGEKEIRSRFRVAAVLQPSFVSLPADALASASEIRANFEMASGANYELVWPVQNAEVQN